MWAKPSGKCLYINHFLLENRSLLQQELLEIVKIFEQICLESLLKHQTQKIKFGREFGDFIAQEHENDAFGIPYLQFGYDSLRNILKESNIR